MITIGVLGKRSGERPFLFITIKESLVVKTEENQARVARLVTVEHIDALNSKIASARRPSPGWTLSWRRLVWSTRGPRSAVGELKDHQQRGRGWCRRASW